MWGVEKERTNSSWDWKTTASSRGGGVFNWLRRARTTAHVTHSSLSMCTGVTTRTLGLGGGADPTKVVFGSNIR